MVTYRSFLNFDPPKILQLWNRCAESRGFGKIAGCDKLEQLLFAKPFFDPYGLKLAFDDERLVGLCHAGFGCNEQQTHVDRSLGTICMVLVDPDCRKQGIGSELLSQAQSYLDDQGVSVQYGGAIFPLNPFYFGLYGGSELPGVLESNAEVSEFFLKKGYVVADTCMVYQRRLDELEAPDDPRIPLLRRQVNLQVEGWPKPATWWQACNLGPMVSLRYEMTAKETGKSIGHAVVWEMETFGRATSLPTVGIVNFNIDGSLRRQGFGKLLLYSVLKHLEEQKIKVIEVQTMQRNKAAQGLYEKMAFVHIDTGHVYRLDRH